ncbi:hypothetical protein, partial [Macromonas bipunctata]|uniref:hypothetical protein n=1 Tax=Macromonas bipunctata TaxID=183670 RepID=UPI00197C7BDA
MTKTDASNDGKTAHKAVFLFPESVPSPDISPQSVETRTALPLKCPNIEVSNLDERTGNAETKL